MLQPGRHHLIFYQNASFDQDFTIGNATTGPDLTGSTFEAEILVSSSGQTLNSCDCSTTTEQVTSIPFTTSFNLATRTARLTMDAATVGQLFPNCSYSRFDQLVVDDFGDTDVNLLQNYDFSKLPSQYRFNLFWLHAGIKDLIVYGAVLVVGG